MPRLLGLVFAAAVGVGCGSPEVGGACERDSDCDAEVHCVSIYKIPSYGCSGAAVSGRVCSLACNTESDCAPLGADFTCTKTYCSEVPGYCTAK